MRAKDKTNPSRPLPPAIFLMGPTAAGKTELAIRMVQELPCEIISVDSAMVYREMDIGTGKPNACELRIAPHHLIDIRDPNQPYSAAEFCHDALKIMKDITDRGRIPLLVGGTFLYFKALTQGLSLLPSADPAVRAKLLIEAQNMGWELMHARLKLIDPDSAARIHPNDPQRIQRALEVYEITGQPMSSLFTPNDHIFPYSVQAFALNPIDRKCLHDRIERRFLNMLAQGLVEEVKKLNQYYDLNPNLPSMRSVGYRQVSEYLAGHYAFEEMIQRATAATRQLAKRQLTWLRSLDNVTHLNIDIKSEYKLLDLCKTVVHCVLLEGGGWVDNPR